ncbi:MAG: penicillin-binding transpeptidase domain-containing protein [Clostridia bacterium]
MKRVIALILILALILPLAACATLSAGATACEQFLEYIKAADYAAAYGMLCAASRNDTEESAENSNDTEESAENSNDTEESAENRISEKEFIDKYTKIFAALEITDISYSAINIDAGQIMTTASFDATYHSTLIGDVTSSFTMISKLEGGIWSIEWSPALIFPDMQWGDKVNVVRIAAKRGEILASGEVVAATKGKLTVYAMPSRMKDETMAVTQLSTLLKLKEADVKEKLEDAYNDLAVIEQYYTGELSPTVRAQLLLIPGVGIDEDNYGYQREYPYGSLLAHTIGYVGPISGVSKGTIDEEVNRLNELAGDENAYTTDSRVGKLGIERQYETQLRGTDGMQIYISTSEGKNRRTLYMKPAKDGYDVHLTVDLKLQQRMEEVLQLVLFGETTAGAVVVINPLTGEVQASASYPTYDLNPFTRGISTQDYNTLQNNPAKPLINRVTQGRYPPGSVFKAFTAAATLDGNVIPIDYVFDQKIDDDYWIPEGYGGWVWSAIKRTYMRNRAEPLNMHNAILNSDNIYFAHAALQMGQDKFLSYMEKMGFTETVPFDIGVAAPQLLNKDTEFTLKFLADSGYGQGEILITPLQLAAEFSAFANGGDIYVPHIVSGLYEMDGIKYNSISESKTELWKQGIISRATIDAILPMLKDVARSDLNGTGSKLRVKNCTVAAKTGTAEIGNDKSREISWFAGFRTGVADKDARLVLVMLEVSADAEMSALKFDIARELLEMPKSTE